MPTISVRLCFVELRYHVQIEIRTIDTASLRVNCEASRAFFILGRWMLTHTIGTNLLLRYCSLFTLTAGIRNLC